MMGKTRFSSENEPAAREAFANLLRECPVARGKCGGRIDAVMGCFAWQMLAKHPEYISRVCCTGKELADYIERYPNDLSLCDWNKLNEGDWREVLLRYPELLTKCEGRGELSGATWVELLMKYPDCIGQCNLAALNGYHWAELICKSLRFSSVCDWGKMDGEDWALVLRKRPKFADRCPWERFTGTDWVTLLARQPQFSERCNWELLSSADWMCLLRNQPQFVEHCNFQDWSTEQKISLLSKKPQLADKINLSALSLNDWIVLLKEQPTLVAFCSKVSQIPPRDWLHLLVKQPSLAKSCLVWDQLLSLPKKDVVRLIDAHSELESYFDREKLQKKLSRSGGRGGRMHRLGGTCMGYW